MHAAITEITLKVDLVVPWHFNVWLCKFVYNVFPPLRMDLREEYHYTTF